MKNTNYQSAVERINKCTTVSAVGRVEQGIARVYEAGCLTPAEVGALFVISMDKAIELSELELSK